MTGEMYKPPNAEKGEDYWDGKSGTLGMGRAIGDEAMLIRPNYPEFFDIADGLRQAGIDETARALAESKEHFHRYVPTMSEFVSASRQER